MNQLNTTFLKRSAAVLALTAGLITGAILGSTQVANGDVNTGTANPIDPAVPAVTIVAKRLTKAEKDQFARQDRESGVNAERTGHTNSGAGTSFETSAGSNAIWKTASMR